MITNDAEAAMYFGLDVSVSWREVRPTLTRVELWDRRDVWAKYIARHVAAGRTPPDWMVDAFRAFDRASGEI